MTSDGLERAIEQSHSALSEFVKGNPEPFQSLYSREEDVTLGNPFGAFVRGWRSVADTSVDGVSHPEVGLAARLNCYRSS